MKKAILFGALGFASSAYAGTDIGTENPCGLGIALGQPTGLSGKCYIGGRRFGWDLLVAYEFLPNNGGAVYVHSTAQWHPTELIDDDWANLSWYVGVGPFLGIWVVNAPEIIGNSGLVVGVRSPIGLTLDFADVPVQVYTEISLGISIIPATDIAMGGGLGVRYYF